MLWGYAARDRGDSEVTVVAPPAGTLEAQSGGNGSVDSVNAHDSV